MLSTLFPTWSADETLLQPVSNNSTSLVGVKTFRNTTGAAIQVYYPSPATVSGEPKHLFRTRLVDFASGYIRLPLSAFLPSIVTTAITTLLSPFLYLNPLNFSTLPRTHPNLPLPPTKHPLIVWSHGLTGTGDEHGLLATTLALKGYVVALVHHSDGSSARCDVVKDGVAARVDYQHVDFSKYDANLRQNQADWRAREVNAARDIVLREFPENVTASNVSVGGFSFGAATAGVVAATRGKEYRCAVLVDGWYHIYFEKYGIDINLPLQLHEKGSQVPTLFIGSEEFQKLERLCAATLAVQKKCPKAVVKVYEGYGLEREGRG